MKILLTFDNALLERYYSRGSRVLFGVVWEHQDDFYPDDSWLDFGSVVLGWWVNAARVLLQGGNHTAFPFMDGPYRLGATREQDGSILLTTEGSQQRTWKVTLADLTNELLRACEEAVTALSERGIKGPDVEQLKSQASLLRDTLKEWNATSRR